MAHDVFISYARADKGIASRIRRLLEKSGIACWIDDRDIPGAAVWSAKIVEAIRGSRSVLLILSAHSNVSSYVADEVHIAADAELPIVTLRIRDVRPSDNIALFVNKWQWLDAFPGPLELYSQKIVQGVAAALHREVPAPAAWWKTRRAFTSGALAAGAMVFGGWKLLEDRPKAQASDPATGMVRGRVVDDQNIGVPGVRVSLPGSPSDPSSTDAAGNFDIDPHAPAGTSVSVHAEKAGYLPADQFHLAGPDLMTIVLTKQTARARE